MRGPSAYPYQQTPGTAPQTRRKRAASPVSISEAAALAGQQGSRKRRLVSGGRTRSTVGNSEPSARTSSRSRLQFMQTSTPITPHIDKDETIHTQRSPAWQSMTPQEHSFDDSTSGKSSTTFGLHEDNAQILSPKSDVAASTSLREDDVNLDNDAQDESEIHTPWRALGIGSALTPRMEQDGDDVFRQLRQPERPRPSVLDTTAAQDVSLPSPSLSPVTAAANMQSRRGYFEPPNLGQISASGRSLDLHTQSQSSVSTRAMGQPSQESQDAVTLELAPRVAPSIDGQISSQSLMNIPSMVDTFEAMPEEMKSYLIYQFLRRCSKPVLHFVADVVNPALKCDFLRLLPVELGLNIIGNLDAKTLCCAAQVSKRWRELIDTSEKVWKRLFDADHYVLPEGELQRAIHEGWGWQYASRPNESEKDLSAFSTNPSDTDPSVSSSVYGSKTCPFAALQSGSTTPQTRRGKRKAKAKSKPTGRKQQRRIGAPSIDSTDLDEEPLLDMASAEGPYAAAHAAALAVPYPPVGLPSLKNLRLFKSIYMRHHIIRKTWMQDEVTPRHIAFRAHQRHVVTCLQFDADKILTGSDDANINVYDTKTGKLRQSLEGHEGGVWALQYQGNVLVSGSTDRTVRVWDIDKGVCTQIFQGHTSTVRCLEILMPTPVEKTADGHIMMPQQPLIITGSRDSNLRVWKLPKPGDPEFFQTGPAPDEGAECPYYVRTLTGHHHSVRAIAAHADTLVSGSYDCSVRVWKISTGESVHRLQGHTQKVYSVVLDTKRNRCISGSMDNLVKVWSLDTGTVLFNLEGHSSLVGLLDLQLDRLVSAAADSTLRIWDPENGRCRSILSAHTGAITCFQHDGQKVISGSDRTLKMWNVANGEFAKDLLTDLSGVWQVKFNERRCVAAVQRNNLTYIEVSSVSVLTSTTSMLTSQQVLDFGAARDGVPAHKRGRRIVVNLHGIEVSEPHDTAAEADIIVDD